MLDKLVVIGYLLLLIIIGLRGGRTVKSVNDFTASGKKCGSFMLFATLSASFVGGGYSSGNAAAAYETGIGTALALFGFSIGMLLIGKFLVPGVARFPHATTVGDVMGAAYGESVRRLTGIFSFLCCAGVVGAQMESIGIVFHSLLGVSHTVGTLIGCSVVLLYTTFGGMSSVLVVDVIQFLLLAIGMPLLLLIAITAGGGVAAVWESVPPSLLNPFNATSPLAWLSLFFAMMCGEALAPPYMQRLLIGKSPQATARGTIYSGLFSMPFFLITAGIGLAARALRFESEAKSVMPELILRILPAGLRGLLMAAMTSIILSAADGFLNGATVSLVCDTILPHHPEMNRREQLHCLRWVNLITGVTAMVLAFAIPDVFSILLIAYSFWSPSILVPLSAALLGIRSSRRSCLLSLITGFTTCLLWNQCLRQPFGIDGCIVGIGANLVVFIIGTYYDRRQNDFPTLPPSMKRHRSKSQERAGPQKR